MDEKKKNALKSVANRPEVEAMFEDVMGGRRIEFLYPVHPNQGVSEEITA